MPTEHRIEWIDFCRIYTAFCVIVRHCNRTYGGFSYIADLFNYRSLIFFFFFMAGYFTHIATHKQWLDWTRTKRLLPPYIFWTLLAVITLVPLQKAAAIHGGDWSWLTWQLPLKEMGLLHWCYWDLSNVPLWYLRTLLLLSLFSPVLQKMRSKVLLLTVLFCFAGSDVLCWADCEAAESRHARGISWLPFRLYESVLALGFYALGLSVKRYAGGERLTQLMQEYAWLPLLGSLALLPMVFFWGFYPPVQSSALVLLGVFTIMSIGALVARYLPRICHTVARLGTAAFFVYVTHFILLHWLCYAITGQYSASFGPAGDLLAPWGILLASLTLYKLLLRYFPGFMRLFALVPVQGTVDRHQ